MYTINAQTLLIRGDDGEFHSIPAIKGEKGERGERGADGVIGRDGTSATHSWNGTTLTITSASGTSSADLKGEKGDQGVKGDDGIDGDITDAEYNTLKAKFDEVIEDKDSNLDGRVGSYGYIKESAIDTKVGTLGYVKLDAIYPVGSIYMSVSSTPPSTLFGGTWEQIQDKFLLSAGSTYSAGSTGGEATHTLTVNEMPSHTHPHYVKAIFQYKSGDTGAVRGNYESDASTAETGATGGGQAHNNMPPYLTVYVWKRTA